MRRIAADKAVGTRVRLKGGICIWRIVKINITRNYKPVFISIMGQPPQYGTWVHWRQLRRVEGER